MGKKSFNGDDSMPIWLITINYRFLFMSIRSGFTLTATVITIKWLFVFPEICNYQNLFLSLSLSCTHTASILMHYRALFMRCGGIIVKPTISIGCSQAKWTTRNISNRNCLFCCKMRFIQIPRNELFTRASMPAHAQTAHSLSLSKNHHNFFPYQFHS